jgi:2-C-methyl-D-erythritol 4-phosphate cytidylyltransferase
VAVVPVDLMDRIRSAVPVGVVVAPGGKTRAASVASGLEEVDTTEVVVHDALRPFVEESVVRAVVAALDDCDGAIAAIPLDETLKRGAEDAVESTLDRRGLWRVQTPQAFRTAVLRAAHDRAAAEGFEAADDAQLVERYGGHIRLITANRMNVRLTGPEDFALAEALVAGRGS